MSDTDDLIARIDEILRTPEYRRMRTRQLARRPMYGRADDKAHMRRPYSMQLHDDEFYERNDEVVPDYSLPIFAFSDEYYAYHQTVWSSLFCSEERVRIEREAQACPST